MGTGHRKRFNKEKSGQTKGTFEAHNLQSCGLNSLIEPESYECSNDDFQNEDLVDTQSLKPHDLAEEDQNSLSIILQPPLLDRKFCSYEEQKMFMSFYGDHRELFLPDTNMSIEKRDDCCVKENMNTLRWELPVRKSDSKHKLCLLYGRPEGKKMFTLLVIEVGEDEFLGAETYSTVSLPFWRPGVGFGSLGSKCYVVGGDTYSYEVKNKILYLDVYVCDLSHQVMSWKKGPMLNGGKPNPIVVTVNGKLYALAGSSGTWSKPYQNVEHVFEVLDTDIGPWRILPEPPFFSMYEQGQHPQFLGHTVIGSVIYFQLGYVENQTLYSFDVDSEVWSEFGISDDDSSLASGSDELILHNLRVGDWQKRTDVVDYLMFRTSGHELENLTIYAYDLTSSIEDRDYYDRGDAVVFHDEESEESSEDSENELIGEDVAVKRKKIKYDRRDFMDEDYVLLLDDKLVTVPVLGLTLIPRYIPGRAQFDSFVSHLGDDLFALVCTFPSRILGERLDDTQYCWRVRACLFKATEIELANEAEYKERFVAANNVKDVTWPIPEMALLHGW